MGHLDSEQVVIEGRLTRAGRERLAQNEELGITQFALGDDEVNYGAWQSQLASGDEGTIIENLPLFEAFSDERQSMRFKLITLEDNIQNVPNVTVPTAQTNIVLELNETIQNGPTAITPNTVLDGDDVGLDEQLGYTAIVENGDAADLAVPQGGEINVDPTIPLFLSDRDRERTEWAIGTEFQVGNALSSGDSEVNTRITIIGNETGLSIDVSLNLLPVIQ